MKGVPSGAVLLHILKKKKMTQKELSALLSVLPHQINNLITGKRKFTIAFSLMLEKALEINIEGFFYMIQCNYEIYQNTHQPDLDYHPDLSKLSRSLFWDTLPEKIDWNRHKDWVIERVFEYGDKIAIEEITQFYGKDSVRMSLSKINKNWKKEIRNKNIAKYIEEN